MTAPPLLPVDAPAASLSETVICDVVFPSAVIDDGEAEIVDSCRDVWDPGSGSGLVDESQLRLNTISAASAPSVRRVLLKSKIEEGNGSG